MTRHRRGRPRHEPALRTRLDDEQRAVAQELQNAAPGWLVMWSYGKRAFTAYPCWSAPTGLVLTEDDPQRLLRAMRAVQPGAPAVAPGHLSALVGFADDYISTAGTRVAAPVNHKDIW
jgi:hypothetical protein